MTAGQKRYPEPGERVRLADGNVYRVQGVTDRGDVIVRGDRLDAVWQVPFEAINEIVEVAP